MEEETEDKFLLYATCYKCQTPFKFYATPETKYWICPKCKVLNKCENLIKKILVDTVYKVEEGKLE